MLIATAAALLLPVANAQAFMDTWITTAFEDTNILAGPEHYSPSANFVERGNRTFFEDYEAKYSDDISQSHLVLYRRDEGFWPNWFTESALVLQFSPYLDPDQSDDGVALTDDGSYVRLVKMIDGDEDHTFSVTGYAVDASRFRLGYSYDLSWGGREIYAVDAQALPGVRVQYQNDGTYAFIGAKSAVSDEIQETSDKRNQAFYGLLAGAGVNLGGDLRLEAGAGSFRQGQFTNVSDTSDPLYGENIQALGVSGQVAWRSTDELDFIQSSELRLYRNSPDQMRDTYISHSQLDGSGVLVQAEVNHLTHNLLDPDNTGSTVLESGIAGDLQAVYVQGSTSIAVDLVYKDLAYILFNVPGLTSGYALSSDLEVTPQVYGRAKISRYFPDKRLTPSIGLGVMQPATYQTDQGVFVQYTERNKEQVPDGQAAANILGSVLGLQVDASKSMVLVGELLYTLDNNLSDFVATEDNPEGERVLAAPEERNQLGFNLIMRSRF